MRARKYGYRKTKQLREFGSETGSVLRGQPCERVAYVAYGRETLPRGGNSPASPPSYSVWGHLRVNGRTMIAPEPSIEHLQVYPLDVAPHARCVEGNAPYA